MAAACVTAMDTAITGAGGLGSTDPMAASAAGPVTIPGRDATTAAALHGVPMEAPLHGHPIILTPTGVLAGREGELPMAHGVKRLPGEVTTGQRRATVHAAEKQLPEQGVLVVEQSLAATTGAPAKGSKLPRERIISLLAKTVESIGTTVRTGQRTEEKTAGIRPI